MSYEIEKKYFVSNFDDTLSQLKEYYGQFNIVNKHGFWWCGSCSGIDNIMELNQHRILKKDVEFLKEIGDFVIPLQDFDYVRSRVHNGNQFVITFKTKLIVNKMEQNTEYEFEVDFDRFKRINSYLKENLLIFYYNIKKSWLFTHKDLKIELSQLNDLRNAYLEIELTGNNQSILVEKLNQELKRYEHFSLKEETKNYSELSRLENRIALRGKKLNKYSKEAMQELDKIIYSYPG